jgi:hypothetical protein
VKFSEVRGIKRSVGRGSKHPKAAWREPFGVETERLYSIRCISMYQAVTTRNIAITREFLHPRTGALRGSGPLIKSH